MKALLLAAGLGTRLRPLTDEWPKCLMPVHGRPLLEYWLGIMQRQAIDAVWVNIHYHAKKVEEFIGRECFKDWVQAIYEHELLGTAGTIRRNYESLQGETLLLAHADNWCCCDFSDFVTFHKEHRPSGTLMTMMTFNCDLPSSCGIVELDERGVVVGFHEKVEDPPGSLANGAVYLLEQEILDWIMENHQVNDFSTEVLPHFLGRIATWKNSHIHKDIGTIEMLVSAQQDQCAPPPWPPRNRVEEVAINDAEDAWQRAFRMNPIHQQIATAIGVARSLD